MPPEMLLYSLGAETGANPGTDFSRVTEKVRGPKILGTLLTL